MVNLKERHGVAKLAAPAVALQNSPVQLSVEVAIQPNKAGLLKVIQVATAGVGEERSLLVRVEKTKESSL